MGVSRDFLNEIFQVCEGVPVVVLVVENATARFRHRAVEPIVGGQYCICSQGAGFAYVALGTDAYGGKTVGWNVSSRLTTESLRSQVLDIASWLTQGNLDELIHHADHGCQYLSLTYSNRLADLGIQASTGSVGRS